MAVALALLVVLILGFIDGARWLAAWVYATEATRYGARLAALCTRSEQSAQAVRSAMQAWLPELPANAAASVVLIEYEDAQAGASSTCTQSDCAQVSVRLQGYSISSLGGLVSGGRLPLPTLRASVARESLNVTSGACAAPQ